MAISFHIFLIARCLFVRFYYITTLIRHILPPRKLFGDKKYFQRSFCYLPSLYPVIKRVNYHIYYKICYIRDSKCILHIKLEIFTRRNTQ